MRGSVWGVLCLLLSCVLITGAQTLAASQLEASSTLPGVVFLTWQSPTKTCEDEGSEFLSWEFGLDEAKARCNPVPFSATSTRCFAPDSQSQVFSIAVRCASTLGPLVYSPKVWVQAPRAASPTEFKAESYGSGSVSLSWQSNGPTCSEAGTEFVGWYFTAYNGNNQVNFHVETEETARTTVFSGLVPLTSYQIQLTQACNDSSRSSKEIVTVSFVQPALVQSFSPSSVFAGGFDTEVFVHNNSTAVDVHVSGALNCILAGSQTVDYSIEYSYLDEYGFPTLWRPMQCSLKSVDSSSSDLTSFAADGTFTTEQASNLGTAYFNCTVKHNTLYQIRAAVQCADPLKSSNHTSSNSFQSVKEFDAAATLSNLHEEPTLLSNGVLVNINSATFSESDLVKGLTFHSLSDSKKKRSGIQVYPVPAEATDFGSLNFELNAVRADGPLASNFTQLPIVFTIHYLEHGFTDEQASTGQLALYFLNSSDSSYQRVENTCPPQFQLSNVDVSTHTWTVYACHLTEFRGFLVNPTSTQVVSTSPTDATATATNTQSDTITQQTGVTNNIIADNVSYKQLWDRKTVAIAVVISIIGTTLLILLVLLLIFILLRKRRAHQAEEEEESAPLPRENVVLVYKSFIPVHNDDVLALSPKAISSEIQLRLDLAEDESSNESRTESSTHDDSETELSESEDASEDGSDDSENEADPKGVTIVADNSLFELPAASAAPVVVAPSVAAPSNNDVEKSAAPTTTTTNNNDEQSESDDQGSESPSESESESESESASESSESSEASEDSDDSESLKPQA